jgi:hypothetical protein
VEAGFSPQLNPIREPLAQAAYALGYVPVAVLGIAGMVLARQKNGVILIGMLFIAFMCVTAVFWAHTSHRSYLDVYLIVFAASTVERFGGPVARALSRRSIEVATMGGVRSSTRQE